MTKNGKTIHEHLENSQNDTELRFKKCEHKYYQNGTISCIKCGKIRCD